MINNNNDKTYGSRKLSVRVPEVSRKSESSEVRRKCAEVFRKWKQEVPLTTTPLSRLLRPRSKALEWDRAKRNGSDVTRCPWVFAVELRN